jgi:hypothetical protein
MAKQAKVAEPVVALGERQEFKKPVRPAPVDGLAAAIQRIEDLESAVTAVESQVRTMYSLLKANKIIPE